MFIAFLINPFAIQVMAKDLPSNIVITGATPELLEGSIYIFCGKATDLIDGEKYQILELNMLKKLFQFEVTFPLQTALGKNKIIGSHDYPPTRQTDVKVRYRDGNAKGYKKGTGEINI